MSRRAILVIAIAGAAAAAAALYLVFRPPQAVAVEVIAARQGDLTATVSAPGVVEPLRQVEISASVSGEIAELPVHAGKQVRKGDLLAQLDQKAYRAQVRQANARIDLARASLAQSKAQYERAQQLFALELISKQEWETARTQFLVDLAQVKEAEAALEQARDQLTDTRITSPISGTVTRLDVEVGEVVVPGTTNIPGTVLMIVADLSRMEVVCDVNESDIAKVTIGQRAAIEIDAFGDRGFNGSVTEISLAATQQNGGGELPAGSTPVDYEVSILIEDTVPELKTGMTADAEIVTAEKKDILIVPIGAVVTRSTRRLDTLDGDTNGNGETTGEQVQVVFVYDNGVARLTRVETGIIGEEYIQITNGLKPGQRIITGPFSALRRLEQGERVEPGRD